MLGMAFDSDGHKRVTTGENFALLGGSEETVSYTHLTLPTKA